MADHSTQRRLAAILAADVAGYTQLMEKDADGTVAAWQAARADVIRPNALEHSGKLVKLTGDGFLIEFPTVLDAVNCAIAVQKGLVSSTLDFRIGVHMGDIIDDGEDIHGEGVNVAARLEGLADAGGICISGSVHEQVRNRIDVIYDDLGEKEVKNVSAPVRVYAIRLDGTDAPATVEPAIAKPFIAILPFENMSADPEHGYFGDGLAEDIITSLSKILSLSVIARNSSFAYKDQLIDIREIAKNLGVSYILEGSVRASGSRIRVTAQLIDATKGNHLWAERYDRQLADVFDIQDDIMREIVTALRLKLSDGEQAQIWLRGTDNVVAWSYAMQGIELLVQANPNAVSEGIELLKKAIEADPDYASAVAWLAYGHVFNAHFDFGEDIDQELQIVETFASRALELDPGLSLAHACIGMAASFREQHEKSIPAIRKALSLSPSDTMIKLMLSRSLINAGQPEEAVIHMKEAMRLNPHCPVIFYGVLANALEMVGNDTEAIDYLEQGIAINNDYFAGHLRLASLYGDLGDLDKATYHADNARRINPRLDAVTVKNFYPSQNQPALKRFRGGLEKAGISLPEN